MSVCKHTQTISRYWLRETLQPRLHLQQAVVRRWRSTASTLLILVVFHNLQWHYNKSRNCLLIYVFTYNLGWEMLMLTVKAAAKVSKMGGTAGAPSQRHSPSSVGLVLLSSHHNNFRVELQRRQPLLTRGARRG